MSFESLEKYDEASNHVTRATNVAVEERRRLTIAFARSLGSSDGRKVLRYLHSITVDRILGPDASDAALRHLEGQRALVHHIKSLIAQGEKPI